MNLKAYMVTSDQHEPCAVAFAETANKAKLHVLGSGWFDGYEYIELRATRLKHIDDEAENFGPGMVSDSIEAQRLMRSLGWYEMEGTFEECHVCQLYPWEELPESQLTEVADDEYICKGCQEAESGKEES